jgi:hypothetical protein
LDPFYYYKGKYKVKIITESEGYWIVEALEDFKDCLEGENVPVKAGERRIVQPSELVKEDALPPMVPEHEYELQLEKKVKRMVEEWKAKKE